MPRYTAINNLLGFGAGASGGGPPSYTFTSTPSSINEGSSGSFTVTTTNVPSGTTLYWTISNTTTANADFSSTSGSFTITSGTGTFSVSPIADYTTEGAETFTVQVRTVSTSGTVVATSSSVTVTDTSTTITATINNVNQGWPLGTDLVRGGKTQSFNVTFTGFTSGTMYWRVNPTGSSSSNFSSTSGSFSVTSSAGTFTITSTTYDQGGEYVTFTVSCSPDNFGTVVGTSATQILWLRYIQNYGWNVSGQLGDGTTVNKSPSTALFIPRSWNASRCGNYCWIGSRYDATIWTAGYNYFGLFGDGSTASIYRSSPSQIGGNWYVGAGAQGAVGISYPSQQLATWGSQANGVCADNTTSGSKLSPGQVDGNAWQAIAPDYYQTLFALRSDYKLYGSGYNIYGQMATGQTPPSSYLSLTAISSSTSFKTMCSSFWNFYAITTTGRLFSSGYNNVGQLGDGTTINRSNFVAVLGTGSSWCMVACAQNSAAAVDITGRLFTWGSGVNGQSGGPTTANRSSPVQILSTKSFLDTSGGDLDGGVAHFIAKATDGTYWGWGQGHVGQIGDNTTANRSSPVQLTSAAGAIKARANFYNSTWFW
jgi:hypothetical protein